MQFQRLEATSLDDTEAAPPATADYVQFHAAHLPNGVALIDQGRKITYAQFDRDLKKFTRAVRQFSLPARSSVAVACESTYLHWLLLLACENAGLATASFIVSEGASAAPLLSYVDLVLCDQPMLIQAARNVHRITQDWVNDILSRHDLDGAAESAPTPMQLGDPQRIRRSSGSTGEKKLMMASRKKEEHTLQNFQLCMGFTHQSRFLLCSYFSVGSLYARATLCLRLGATSIAGFRTPLADAIATFAPTHVMLFPYQVKLILDELPKGFVKRQNLTVMLTGGPLSDALTERLLTEVASDLVFTFGTNETSTIAIIDKDGIGTLLPGVQAEVIDDRDVAVPFGQAGRLRIKSNSMADGYLGDPETSARLFRNGWFYSGDAGIFIGKGRLKLLGRVDEMLIIGGLKYSPLEIEDAILKGKAAREVGVTSIASRNGIEELCIALVLDGAATLDAAKARIADHLLRGMFDPIHFIAAERLPRTDTGKLQRHQLKAMFQRHA